MAELSLGEAVALGDRLRDAGALAQAQSVRATMMAVASLLICSVMVCSFVWMKPAAGAVVYPDIVSSCQSVLPIFSCYRETFSFLPCPAGRAGDQPVIARMRS